MHNDRGIRYFQEGDYDDALLQFIQARTADATAGEIHFNLALVRIQLGEEDKVPEHLQLAKRYADDNPRILNSPLLKKYLAGNPG
ncbi:MAG: hypothetical protein GWM98_03705 [Nitrospinaceae bacterium]|nr:hypothetical protein [Nitrospinaceae bacterium]NIR53774.1 hypothetical protein [Nitrospinaceae bacterium]NIS84184.1 hypothetical protein [Nitrospinaceae bacterium]NIT80990.1 hypothetical protein [Nitrospinaceae bacterium]NIU43280.1 hypothetical protein [Nitrospinaceae bacterium]